MLSAQLGSVECRVGADYQAVVPRWNPLQAAETHAKGRELAPGADPIRGHPVWNPPPPGAAVPAAAAAVAAESKCRAAEAAADVAEAAEAVAAAAA